MTENIVGKLFLGKDPTRHVDYVWGQVLEDLGSSALYGFFPWGVNVEPNAEFRTALSPELTAGYRYFSTAQELNAAVQELARAHFVLDQYKAPKTVKRKSRKKAAVKPRGEVHANQQ
jgi:hypothetical protein